MRGYKYHLAFALILAIPSIVSATGVDGPVTVRIIYSNDVYGQLVTQDVGGEQLGGIAPRVQLIRDLTAEYPSVVVDAGDALAPGALAVWDQGRLMAAAMRRAGYVAMAPGNHDFSYGLETLEARRAEAGLSLLAANVTVVGTPPPLDLGSTLIVDTGGVRIGILGVISEEVARKLNPKLAAQLTFNDPVGSARVAAGKLREDGVDYVVALVHMPEQEALALAQKVDGIDLLIAGGYTYMDDAATVPFLTRLVNGVHVVTTPRSGHYVGLVEARFVQLGEDGYRLDGVDSELISVDGEIGGDPVVEGRLADLQSRYAEETGAILGRIEGTNLEEQAQAIAGLMRNHTKSEVGIVNMGAFRGAVQNDTLSLRDVDRFIRFDDTLVEMVVKGSQLRSIAKRSNRMSGTGGKLAFSGLDVDKMMVNHRPIQNEERYRVVTLEFLAGGGDGYVEFKKGTGQDRTGISMRSLTIAGLKAWGALSPSSFDELSSRGVWRSGWSAEGAFRRNYIDATTEIYRAQGERVSFLSGETSIAWNGATRFFLGHEVGPHVFLFENANDFGQIGSGFSDLETSTDRLDADITYRYRIRGLKVDPFASTGISTAFRKADDTRPFLHRASVGFQMKLSSKAVLRFAGRAQRNYSVDLNDYGAEVSMTYQTQLPQGSRFRSDFKSFFGLSDRRVISIENYNTLSVPLVSGLSLIVRQNNFAYRVNLIKGVEVDGIATRTDLTVGMHYALDWKWF